MQVKVFWVVMLCSVVVGYQCFRGLCCLHLQGITAQHHNPDDLDLMHIAYMYVHFISTGMIVLCKFVSILYKLFKSIFLHIIALSHWLSFQTLCNTSLAIFPNTL